MRWAACLFSIKDLSMVRCGARVVSWWGWWGRVIRSGFLSWMIWGRGWVVWLSLRVVRGAFIGDLGNITIVMVSSVLDMLGSAIWKSNRVGSAHCLAIGSFSCVEGSLRVVIGNGIFISIWLRRIFWLLVRGRSRVVSRLVDCGSLVVGRLMDNSLGDDWSRMIHWLVDHRRWVVCWLRMVWLWCRFVCRDRGMVNRGWLVNWCRRVVRCGTWVVDRLRVIGGRGGMIRSWSIAMGQSSRGMNLSYRLLVSSVSMD